MHSLIVLLALAALAVAAGGATAAPEKAAGGIRFTYTDPNAGAVSWAGEFNGWNASATPMAKDAKGVWSVVVALPAGEHQYKFVVDGQWIADPENGATAGDMGNSVVRVGADGNLGVAQATANSPYSAKILIGGRIIGLFQDVHNAAHPPLRDAPAGDGHRPVVRHPRLGRAPGRTCSPTSTASSRPPRTTGRT